MAFIPEAQGSVSAPVDHGQEAKGSVSAPVIHGTSKGTNIALYSEQFDNAAWSKVTTNGASLQANANTAPDGTLTADLYKAGNSLGIYSLTQTVDIPDSETATFSIHAKQSGVSYLQLHLYTNANTNQSALFDLSTGQVVSTTSTDITARITPVANGYYRCSVSMNFSVGASANNFLATLADANGTAITGNLNTGILFWGAMVELDGNPSNYVKTLGSPKTVGEISAPVSHTAKTAGSISVPNTPTAKTKGSIAVPNTPTAKTKGSVSAPVDHGQETAGSIAVPNTPTAKTKGSIAVPNTPTAKTAGSIAVPNTPTAKTKGSMSAPVSHTALTQNPIPRALTPLLNFDFTRGLYSKCGIAKTFDDLFTYTRSSSATYWDRRLNDCGQYEYFLNTDYVGNVTNLATYSEDLTNAAWVKTLSPIVSVSDYYASDIGGYASNLQSNNAASFQQLKQSFSITSGSTYTATIRIKKQTSFLNYPAIGLVFTGGTTKSAYAIINEKTGVVNLSSNTAGNANYKSVDMGSYFEISLSATDNGSNNTVASYIYPTISTNGITNATAIGSIRTVWAFQLTQSQKPLPYVKTISLAVTKTFTESPRIEYDPLTGENKGVLIEGGVTNHILNSEDFASSSWFPFEASITANQSIAPDGTKSMDKLIASTVTTSHQISEVLSTFPDNSDCTISTYAKAGEYSGFAFVVTSKSGTQHEVRYDLSSGTITQDAGGIGKIESLPNGIYRCSISIDSGVGANITIRNRVGIDGSTFNFAGGGTSGIYLWGSQVEKMPFATSYVRTESSAVARARDILSVSNATNGQTDGSLFFDYSVLGLNTGVNQYIGRMIYNTSNQISAIMSGTTARQRIYMQSNGVVVVDNSVPISDATLVNTLTKWGVTYENNQMSFYKDGTLKYTDLVAPPISNNISLTLELGINGSQIFGHITKTKLYDKALTDQEVSLL